MTTVKISASPDPGLPSIAPVETAIPAFIGYTERATDAGADLGFQPRRIRSLAEFEAIFGGEPRPVLELMPCPNTAGADATAVGGKSHVVKVRRGVAGGDFLLHRCLQHFYANGGGDCFIVSVGDYRRDLEVARFKAGLDRLLDEEAPTLLVIPEAVCLPQPECVDLQQAMLLHCGSQTKSRFAILDVFDGDRPLADDASPESGKDPLGRFRSRIGDRFLDHAAAYFPWLETTLVDEQVPLLAAFADRPALLDLLRIDLGLSDEPPAADAAGSVRDAWDACSAFERLDPAASSEARMMLERRLVAISPLCAMLVRLARKQLNRLPPSAAMAGIYASTDATRGVWKSPSGIQIAAVSGTCGELAVSQVERLNHPADGRSVNALRSRPDGSVVVWGARTLAGRDPSLALIGVRRTLLLIERACRVYLRSLADAPDDEPTLQTVHQALSGFLHGVWQGGGLYGASETEAYAIDVHRGRLEQERSARAGRPDGTGLTVVLRLALVETDPHATLELRFEQALAKG